MVSYLSTRKRRGTLSWWGLVLLVLASGSWLLEGCAPARYSRRSHHGRTATTSKRRSSVQSDSPATRAPRAPRRARAGRPSPRPARRHASKHAHRKPTGKPLRPLALRPNPQIEEADLLRMRGSLLLYLHSHRGLTVFNLKTPESPRRVASLPVYGTPVEMFVSSDLAVILVNNVTAASSLRARRNQPVQPRAHVVTVDISNPNAPELLDRVGLPGTLREGLARKRGNTLYVVSHQKRRRRMKWHTRRYRRRGKPRVYRHRRWVWTPERLYVHSFDLKKPRDIRAIARMSLLDGKRRYTRRDKHGYENHSYTGRFVLSATNSMLMLTKEWRISRRKNYTRLWNRRCYKSHSGSYSQVHLIDISDRKGNLERHGVVNLPGRLLDPFKQTHVIDTKARRSVYMGVTLQRAYRYDSCSSRRRSRRIVRNQLITVDVTVPHQPKQLAALSFGKRRETVRGTLFDSQRQVLYAITAVRRDPLYAIDVSDPARPKVLSAIDGLSGDIHLFRTLQNGNFLVAVGRDNSRSCRGFGRGRWGSQVAVSLFDVRDLKRARLIQRRCVRVRGSRRTYSAINRRRDRAHKMIGLHLDNGRHLLSIPFFYYSRYYSRIYGRNRSAVALMEWDLRRYQPKRSHQEQKVLTNLGSFHHPRERIQRTLITTLPHTKDKKPRRVAIALSRNYLSVADLTNLKKPRFLSSLAIAPETLGVYRFGKVIVEHTREWRQGKHHHQLHLYQHTARHTLGRWLRRLSLGDVRHIVRWKQSLLVVGHPLKETRRGKKHLVRPDTSRTKITRYNFRRPTRPHRAGIKILPFRLTLQPQSECSGRCGGTKRDYLQFRHGRPKPRARLDTSQGLILLARVTRPMFGRNRTRWNLLTLRVRNNTLDATTTLLPFEGHQGLVPFGPNAFFVTNSLSSRQGLSHVQLWTWRKNAWQRAPWLTVPGHLLHVKNGKTGLTLLSIDHRYRQFYVSRYPNDQKQVKVEQQLAIRCDSALLDGQTLYITRRHHRRRTSLAVYRLGGAHPKHLGTHYLGQQSMILRHLHNDQLLIQSNLGFLVMDVSQPKRPHQLTFRSPPRGAALHLHQPLIFVKKRNSLLVAARRAGILRIPIRQPTPIASQQPNPLASR